MRRVIYSTLFVLMALGASFFNGQSVFAQSPGITSPAAGSSVSGDVLILGTAVIEPFQRYELSIKQEPNGDDAFIYVSGGTQPVQNGQLGVINVDTFAPGTYSIRLRVVKLDGNYAEYFAPNLSFNLTPATPTPPAAPTPTETPSEPTPTATPTITFTPAPQPTPIVGQVTQPNIQNDAASPTPIPTVEPVAVVADINSSDTDSGDTNSADTIGDAGSDSSETGDNLAVESITLPGNESSGSNAESVEGLTSQIGAVVGLDRLRERFINGMQYSALAFILIGIIFLAKAVLGWMRTQF